MNCSKTKVHAYSNNILIRSLEWTFARIFPCDKRKSCEKNNVVLQVRPRSRAIEDISDTEGNILLLLLWYVYTIRCRKRVFQDHPPEPIIAIIVCSSRDKPFKSRRNRTSPGTYCVIRGLCASHGPRSQRLGAHYNYYYHYRYLRPRESLRLSTYNMTYVHTYFQQQQECSSPSGGRAPPGKADSGTKLPFVAHVFLNV